MPTESIQGYEGCVSPVKTTEMWLVQQAYLRFLLRARPCAGSWHGLDALWLACPPTCPHTPLCSQKDMLSLPFFPPPLPPIQPPFLLSPFIQSSNPFWNALCWALSRMIDVFTVTPKWPSFFKAVPRVPISESPTRWERDLAHLWVHKALWLLLSFALRYMLSC